eukprot:CAMPEP_0194375778 /NCGR_PEP_ID=MMETSP0174-20130528/24335_1 /TAXON_ID=216777 /ORGANISM="Proboscia alata, Strain PI-D3" /LENGTH=430 /DNA_ID=CAMNT_0039156211 /DNA_START=281 /DNA_END=1573 /DNA_ORIENTATION=+
MKWERIFNSGSTMDGSETDAEILSKSLMSEVKVVSFDLDNTLWKTSNVISFANSALNDYLNSRNINQPLPISKVMGDIFKSHPEKYRATDEGTINNTDDNGEIKKSGPVFLTQLRKDAIAEVCTNYNGFNHEEAVSFASDAFAVWTRARHSSIPDNYADSVVECLEKIRRLRTSDGHPIIVGAITDGNSNPKNVQGLEHFFDFCVNAEQVGVGKPNRKVYESAVRQVFKSPYLRHIFNEREELDEDTLEELVGRWWVHVGDDFLKDMVGAKALRMRSIWSKELVLNQKEGQLDVGKESGKKDKDVGEFVKEITSLKKIEMTIGSDDYLLDSLERDFVDATAMKFLGVYDIISEWHNEGLGTSLGELSYGQIVQKDALAAADREIPTSVNLPVGVKENTAASDAQLKFCVICGSKIPLIARFCSSCGEKQS